MVNGQKKTWNEAAEAQFDVLSQYLFGDYSPVSSLRLEPGTSKK